MSITIITSLSQLDKLLANKDKISVIDFHATWCGPCKFIAPTYAELAKANPNIQFLKCDTDEAQDVAAAHRISAMPTFLFFRGATQIDMVRGADKSKLTATVNKYASSSSSSAFSGQGQTLGGSSTPQANATQPKPDSANFAPLVGGNIWNAMDPQVKLFVALVAAYGIFWYLK